ncbi:MAG: hypothetical protein IKJ98_00860 [Bacteroidales bacterium]|nr:hypothetical protein [Bacteroidales bacterium]
MSALSGNKSDFSDDESYPITTSSTIIMANPMAKPMVATDVNVLTGKQGVYNMGRNITVKILVPIGKN